MLLQRLMKRKVRRRLQQKILETKLWNGWGKQRNENLKTAKSQMKENPGEAVMMLSSICRRRLNQTKHSEKDEKDEKKRRRNKSFSVPSNVHTAAILLAGNGSTAATESTNADVNGTAKSGNVCDRKPFVKRVTEKSLGFFKYRSVLLYLRASSVTVD